MKEIKRTEVTYGSVHSQRRYSREESGQQLHVPGSETPAPTEYKAVTTLFLFTAVML